MRDEPEDGPTGACVTYLYRCDVTVDGVEHEEVEFRVWADLKEQTAEVMVAKAGHLTLPSLRGTVLVLTDSERMDVEVELADDEEAAREDAADARRGR